MQARAEGMMHAGGIHDKAGGSRSRRGRFFLTLPAALSKKRPPVCPTGHAPRTSRYPHSGMTIEQGMCDAEAMAIIRFLFNLSKKCLAMSRNFANIAVKSCCSFPIQGYSTLGKRQGKELMQHSRQKYLLTIHFQQQDIWQRKLNKPYNLSKA